MIKKVGILSLGCARNLVDSEIISGRLEKKGFQIINLERIRNSACDKIDTVLVNTCAFIEEAKEESIQAILDLIELKKRNKLKRIIVSGCLSQRYKDELRRHLPEVDAFQGVISLNHRRDHFRLTPGHYAYVKICDGCLNTCSFCVIPRIKPRLISRDIDSIIYEIKCLDMSDCREVNLIGQDITAYGKDLYSEFRLPELIRRILRNSQKIKWIRLLYLSPERLSDELIELIAHEPRIVKYIDLPLQHINNRIFRLMRRNINSSQILRLIEKIRKKIPGVAIRTSFIVGFPTETDKEFKQLINFIQQMKFERLGLFMYSREENTLAFGLKGQVPQKTKEERYNIVMSCQQEIASQVNKKWQDRVLEILIEEEVEEGLYIGRSQYDAPEVDGLVYVRSKTKLSPGSFVKVFITDTLEYDLVGEANEYR